MKNLINFCNKLGIYSTIYYNTAHYCQMKKPFYDLLEGKKLAGRFFAYAFIWRNTKEGYSYWADVPRMWRDYCDKNNIIILKR